MSDSKPTAEIRPAQLHGGRGRRCRHSGDGACRGTGGQCAGGAGPINPGRCHAEGQRQGSRAVDRCAHRAARRLARTSRSHRQQEGLRSRPVRRLHGAGRRPPGAVVPDPGGRRRWASTITTIEGLAQRRQAASDAAGLHRPGRVPVRLLHAGPDHVGDRLCRKAMPAATTKSANI